MVNLRNALLVLSVLFFIFAGLPPAPTRLSVNWQWWGVAALIAALWLANGGSSLK